MEHPKRLTTRELKTYGFTVNVSVGENQMRRHATEPSVRHRCMRCGQWVKDATRRLCNDSVECDIDLKNG